MADVRRGLISDATDEISDILGFMRKIAEAARDENTAPMKALILRLV